jgi:hypothetical protein
MTSAQKISWKRLAAESTAIVASILLAFAIDAWWDERQERKLEAEYLTAIIGEIDRNLEALPGNRGVLERSFTDLLRARDLLSSGTYMENANAFLMSLNRGLIYGVPSISTAVFDDLSNSGRMVIIKDFGVRRLIMDVYATIAAELVRFARRDEPVLANLVGAHTPPGLITQVGPRFSFDEAKVPPIELHEAARALGSEEDLANALNAELRRREQERAFLDYHEERLRDAREDFAAVMRQVISVDDAALWP